MLERDVIYYFSTDLDIENSFIFKFPNLQIQKNGSGKFSGNRIIPRALNEFSAVSLCIKLTGIACLQPGRILTKQGFRSETLR